MKPGIIQLENVDGHAIGLYLYDQEKISEADAVHEVEAAIEGCAHEENPHGAADEALEERGIQRIYAEPATTEYL